jgi:hypothetical protein
MYLGSFVSAADVIRKICLRTEDMNMSKARLYASYMSAVWNDLRMDGTKTSVLRKFQINKRTNSLPLPNDCLLLFGVGYEDDMGVVKPLWYNTKIPKHLMSENGVSCACETCGDSNMNCKTISTVSEFEEVVSIGETDYLKKRIVLTMTDGRVIEKITQPVMTNTPEGDVVEMVTTENELCRFELKPCGCVKNTEANNENVRMIQTTFCGLDSSPDEYNQHNPIQLGYAIDVTGEQILLSDAYPYNYIVLKYLTNITHEASFKIPALAEECFIKGIMYYANNDDPKALVSSKSIGGSRYNEYEAEQKKLRKRLRPTDYNKVLAALGATRENEFQRLTKLDVINSNNIDGWNQIYWFNRY